MPEEERDSLLLVLCTVAQLKTACLQVGINEEQTKQLAQLVSGQFDFESSVKQSAAATGGGGGGAAATAPQSGIISTATTTTTTTSSS
eukprot:CAMPEP_0175151666 /NCGR_PEP_ID=MMETSP0087-20121206/18654_1 /TAXON_ID=136419 /ORGANISM="Unknown Unknown, Strain D1" /LENGTH=87 /DNA_ID=CAMNT_0016437951 /DNA_START=59 /DNA_END=319 /DNA_ORIENTATION=+